MIPALEELKALPHWVGWKTKVDEDGKPTKVPYVANNGKHAKPNDPRTWVDFATAAHAYKGAGHDGLGFVTASDDPYCGIDLDKCRDPASGAIADWALAIVDRFNSYTEVTPSKTGLRIWIKARKAGPKCAKAMGDGKLEIYDHERFFTVTGARLEGAPLTIEDRQTELDVFYAEVWPEKPSSNSSSQASSATTLTAYAILDLARRAKNADKWDRLMRGDLSEYHGDDSDADAGLCALAAFYTDDPSLIDQIVRMSGLNREKWNRADYRERTISGALELVTERYRPPDGGEIRGKAPVEAREHLRGMNAAELIGLDLPDLRQHFAGLLPEGLGVAGAPPKAGKSLLCYQLAAELVTCGSIFGIRAVERTAVRYYALEDGQRRSQRRIRAALRGRTSGIEALELEWTAPRLGSGLEEEISGWLAKHSNAVVIVDVLAKVRPNKASRSLNAYDEDYQALTALHNVSRSHPGSTILLVTHDRKAGSEDWMTRVTGTRGITGAVDFVIFIHRKRTETFGTIFVTGRDIADSSIDVNFTGEAWERAAIRDKVAQEANTRRTIFEWLTANGPAKPVAVALGTGLNHSTVRVRMPEMAKAELLELTPGGLYGVPSE